MTSRHFNRRTFLCANGISLALPWLEATAGATDPHGNPPRRFCGIYFPFGVCLPFGTRKEDLQWNWFPHSPGGDFRFNESLKCLEPFRRQLTIVGGLEHANAVDAGGHDTADTFLTGARMRANQTTNTVSLDQFLVPKIGRDTRFTSLVFSLDGGVGVPGRSHTLSYDRLGQPLASENNPRRIFQRLFGTNAESLAMQRRDNRVKRSHLDLLLNEARSLNNKLGKSDRTKLDEYLSSIREVEKQVHRADVWLDRPKPNVDASGLALNANVDSPREWIRTMLDLIVLAFQTDSSRIATFQWVCMRNNTVSAQVISQRAGFGDTMHGLAHGMKKPGGVERLGKWDRWQAENLAYFLGKLDTVKEGDQSLLDSSVVLYGSSNSRTHHNLNYPLILSGGGSMGFKHGQYLQFRNHAQPLSSLFLSIIRRMGLEAESFADSSGELKGI